MSPFTVAAATRTLVNEPGPSPTTSSSRSPRSTPAAVNTSSMAGTSPEA